MFVLVVFPSSFLHFCTGLADCAERLNSARSLRALAMFGDTTFDKMRYKYKIQDYKNKAGERGTAQCAGPLFPEAVASFFAYFFRPQT